MTDTGQVPGEGQPESAGGQLEQPVAPAPGTYTFENPADGVPAGDEDDLLLPSAQGAWGETAAVPSAPAHGPHETPGPGQAPAGPAPSVPPARHEHGAPRSATPTPPRPLHLGPPVPEQSGMVRSLADRGPTPPPAPPGFPETAPVGRPGPYTTEPEPFEVAHEGPAVTGDRAVVPEAAEPPGPQPGVLPQEPAPADAWAPQPSAPVPAPEQQGPATGEFAEPLPGPDLAAIPAPDGGAAGWPQTPVPAPEPEQSPSPAPEQAPAPAGPEAFPEAAFPEAAGPATGTGTGTAEPVTSAEPAGTDGTAEATVPGPHSAPEPSAATPEQQAQDFAEPQDLAEPQHTATPAGPADVPDAEDAGEPAGPPEAPQPEVQAGPRAEDPAEAPAGPPAPEPAGAPVTGPVPAPEQQLAMASVPGAGPQVMEAVPVAPSGESAAGAAAEVPAAGRESAPPSADGGSAAADGESRQTAEDTAPAAAPVPEPAVRESAVPEEEQPAPQVPEGREDTAAEGTGRGPAPGYGEAEREALHRVMRERRDVRNGFRPDPIPDEVLLRVLEAAHTAPSVGHSQPWDFVLIRSEETRRTMHELAMRQRDAYAMSLPKGRAKQFREMKVEAILDTPVNIVVTADPTRGGRHTLGRHTQPQMAPYSSALAVENLWLAARAEGLGVGWVSFFDEREMVRVLGLPEHLEVVAYLCVGYVDAFPDEPELVQAGWSKRRPLSWVVHEESYGRRVLPGAEQPHDLLTETLQGIRPLDAKALGEAWERQKRMTKPSGALGMLEIISAQLSGLARRCPPPVPEPAAVAVFAGDHGVHAQGVTAWPQEVTAQMVANFLAGGAVCNAFAGQVGAEICVVDVGVAGELPNMPGLLPRKVRSGTADFTTGPALTREEVMRALEVGIETARDLVAAGNKALLTGEMGIANTTVSAALVAVFTGADPAEVTGRGTGVSDEMHAHKIDVVRRALELHRPDAADPLGVLAAVGGLEHAALAGLILGGASLRTPVILDGVSAGAAALVARAIAPEALAACIAGHRSAEPGHVAALAKLGLRPLIDLDLRLGEGTGALLALPVVQSAARAMHEVATFDSAGVTEKN
ncbi:nicotinate-nucleotide--dimethylbenzimidazole phosphoribosyltransferase [Streptomyces sp. TRM 70361]|uniref:nicotinate-nucleotide--dimethylbenzimidazole phosphoribosyltransferase n=1 Tax=Streptomyces sp. TRM 70361 TaxID=3116553 RepID=UPI002E7C2D76|nr:nicotinate-nucleotide--dimethylbenzimidazole phosphoribosyltransferase [Streptomyces sp. TRM 70361]MEE1939091.1 nicotinate-nucleotide--dimethylbenzimidazole phosphoribosyltransferase [Streptomyces sp. TRM 70361]